MKDSLIIYSGGMDSTVLLHDQKDRIGLAISFDYGSKHNDREYESAQLNTTLLGIPHKRVDLKVAFLEIASDLLKSGGEIPEGHYEHESMKRTIVPFRNGIMLAIAAGIAESNGLKRILIANHYGDHAIYPDCRARFIQYMDAAVQLGTDKNVTIEAPFSLLLKSDIAILGKAHGIDFTSTYSCYKGHAVHCGKCGTCVERREALNLAYEGNDPTEYDESL